MISKRILYMKIWVAIFLSWTRYPTQGRLSPFRTQYSILEYWVQKWDKRPWVGYLVQDESILSRKSYLVHENFQSKINLNLIILIFHNSVFKAHLF